MEEDRRVELLLKLATFSVLLGRGLQHIFFDVPYRAIFWNEELLAPIFSLFSWNWTLYVTSKTGDNIINLLTIIVGSSLVLVSLLSLFRRRKFSKLISISGYYLIFLSFLFFINKYFIIAQFFEYSSQMVVPFSLVYFWKFGITKKLLLIIRIAIALTFIGHGSYALGIFPTPGNFLDMVILILQCSEDTAVVFLKIMGSLDFIAAILLFVPAARSWSLNFCFAWGLLTTLARVFGPSMFGVTHVLASSGYEFLVRVPHFILPLLLMTLAHNKKGFSKEAFNINS